MAFSNNIIEYLIGWAKNHRFNSPKEESFFVNSRMPLKNRKLYTSEDLDIYLH